MTTLARTANLLRTSRLTTGAAVVALGLGACGSSSANTPSTSSTPSSTTTSSGASSSGAAATTASSAATTTPAATATTTAATPAASYPAGCSKVAQPAPRSAPHIAKPTGHLATGKSWTVTMVTNCGTIVIDLANTQAPVTDNSFAYLVKQGFYNDLTFHRIVAGFVIQGGDPLGNGLGGPGYTVVEAPPASTKYTPGTVAMAKSGAQPSGASGSQFFIVTGTGAESLPAQYALVGHVTSASEATLARIQKVPVSVGTSGEDSQPDVPVVIEKATLRSS